MNHRLRFAHALALAMGLALALPASGDGGGQKLHEDELNKRFGKEGPAAIKVEESHDGLAFEVSGSCEYPDGTILVAGLHEKSTREAIQWFRTRLEGQRYSFKAGPLAQRLMAGDYFFEVFFVLSNQLAATQIALRQQGFDAGHRERAGRAYLRWGTEEAFIEEQRQALTGTRALMETFSQRVKDFDQLYDKLVPDGAAPTTGALEAWNVGGQDIGNAATRMVAQAYEKTNDVLHYRYKAWIRQVDGCLELLTRYFQATQELLGILGKGSTGTEEEQKQRELLDRHRRQISIDMVQRLRRLGTDLDEIEHKLKPGQTGFERPPDYEPPVKAEEPKKGYEGDGGK